MLKMGKACDQLRPLPRWMKKISERLYTNNKVYVSNVYPTKINRAPDFAQLYASIANISGMDKAIDKRKTALSSTIPSTFDDKKLVNFGPQTKKVQAANIYPLKNEHCAWSAG